MTTAIDLEGTLLPPEQQRDVKVFCAALEEKLGAGLVNVTLYGSGARDDFRPNQSDVNLLVVATALDRLVLSNLLEATTKARRAGLAPFFLTETELTSSTDIFPVKFLSMKESHRCLLGRDVLAALPIGREHVRLRCEQELMNLLLKLRKRFLDDEGRGLDKAIAETVGGLLDALRFALTLTGEGLVSRRDVPEAAARRMELDAKVLRDALDLRDREDWLPKDQMAPLFERYLSTVSRAARFVDSVEEHKAGQVVRAQPLPGSRPI